MTYPSKTLDDYQRLGELTGPAAGQPATQVGALACRMAVHLVRPHPLSTL